MHIPSHIIMAFILFHAAYVMPSRSFPLDVGVSIAVFPGVCQPCFCKKTFSEQSQRTFMSPAASMFGGRRKGVPPASSLSAPGPWPLDPPPDNLPDPFAAKADMQNRADIIIAAIRNDRIFINDFFIVFSFIFIKFLSRFV